MKTHLFLVVAGLLAFSVSPLHAYGPEGHEAIGAIAEERLAGTPTGARVKELLEGLPLSFAATIPDRIKSWDRGGGEDDPHGFKMPDHPKLEAQLRAFWEANKPTPQNDDAHPSHHWFHYTDVPLVGDEKYAGGTVGRGKWDIVHMIPYCCRVLSGQEPETNERAITKPVALILLAHYVGDIHQPLHVGAEYFDNGRPANPDTDKAAIPDEGGNTFLLALVETPGEPNAPRRRPKLHGYWDSNTVKNVIEQVDAEIIKANPGHPPDVTPTEFDHYMTAHEPANWKPADTLDVKDWAESWANEILPIAREAYDRLDFTQLKVETSYGKQEEAGVAVERPGEQPPYADWSTGIVRMELEKGGYRLAAMLQKVLR